MTQTDYVLAAYVVTAIGVGGVLIWAWLTMKAAEK